MYNTKRLAYALHPPPDAALRPGSTDDPAQHARGQGAASPTIGAEQARIDAIVQQVLAELKR